MGNFTLWEDCTYHTWEEIDSQSDKDVRCTHCGMPGEKDPTIPGGVYFPAS